MKKVYIDRYSPQKNKVYLGQQYPDYSGLEGGVVVIIKLMELKQFSYYFLITNTLNMSIHIWELVSMEQYSPGKTPKDIYNNDVKPMQYWRKYGSNSSYL